MKIHRFIEDFDFSKKELEINNIEIVKQIRNVLKLEIGKKITLSDGKGTEADTIITFIYSDKISCEVVEVRKASETTRKVRLYLAILKKDNFELAIQKSVECGVSSIIPIITERTIKTGLNKERLEKIIKEASEQSGRSVVPELLETMTYKEALEHGSENKERVIFDLGEENYKPDGSKASFRHTVSIFIGPEGGFTEKEISLAKESNYQIASLGDMTLRGETAAIVATYRAVQGI